MDKQFVLKGNLCYSRDLHTLHTVPDGYLVCEDGVSLGVYEALPAQYRDWLLVDYGDALIIPGLTDLHTHASQFAFRALGMDMQLLDWLDTHTFPEETKFSDLAYAGAVYDDFVADMVKGPNTRACVFATAHVPATLLLMDRLEASGLITKVGKVNMDRNSMPGLQEADAGASLWDTETWLQAAEGRYTRTAPILTPRFIPSCSDALLEGLAAIQARTGLPVQSHLSENPDEAAWVQALHPDSAHYADAYARFGLFGDAAPTIMAHCVWSSEAEMDMIRQQGVYVAHCPQSNVNLSSGIAPVRHMLRMGIHVGLGSDVAAGCHTSMLRAMADAIQASKLRWRYVEDTEPALTLAEAFYMATIGGGSFFGRVGSFAPGWAMDAVVIDDSALRAPFPLRIEQRLARATYLSDDRHIAAKYVAGRKIR